VHHLIEAGQRLAEKKASLGRGEWLPWLEANYEVLGFGPRTAQRLLKLGDSKYEVNVALDEADAVQISRLIWGNTTTRGTTGTGDNEWFTPAQYIRAARDVMGGIDLDPATHPLAQETVQATGFFTADNDGLDKQWRGRIWLNPPYAQPLIAQFIEKLVGEVSAGRVVQAILLTHNYTDTAWFHQAEAAADLLCFTRGRIKFIDADGDECAPTQGQAFFYYGPQVELFRDVFSRFGFVR
jgi:phage N-6-adenine-methyltransferase